MTVYRLPDRDKFAWQDPVLDKDLTAPPGGESEGDRYIVAATATGAWIGHENKIAEYNGSGWDFYTPTDGWRIDVVDEDALYRYSGSAWEEVFDPTAIHDNIANEISAITAKTNMVANDIFVLEDSENSFVKKKVRLGDMLGGGGGIPVGLFPFFSNTTEYKETASTSWETVGSFIFRGSDEITPAIMKVIASRSGAIGSSEIRLYDVTNAVEIGCVTFTSETKAIYTDSSLGAVPTSDAIFEVQAKIVTGSKTRIHFLGLY